MISRLFICLVLVTTLGCSEQEPTPLNPNAPSNPTSNGIIQDTFEGSQFFVYANADRSIMVAFSREYDGSLLEFESLPGGFPNIVRDNEGNNWNVFGQATSGPRKGEFLTPMNATIGFYFSFAAFFPDGTSLQVNL